MPRVGDSSEIQRKDIFRCILKFLISPVWFTLEWCAYYTQVSQFLLTNVAFFHYFLIVPNYALFSIPFLDLKNIPESVDAFWIMFYFYTTVYMMGPLPLPVAIRNFTPRVQKMSHVILGLFGMILSSWMALGAFIAIGFEYHITTSTYILIISMCLMFLFYFTFCSAKTNLYVRLPPEQLPFSGIKLYVILFGLFHLAVAVATIFLPKNAYICLPLIAFSFIFCCDAWSCLFTDIYMLCEHREFKFQMKKNEPMDGIIYIVAVRKNYKIESNSNKPIIHSYDTEIEVDAKWLQDNDMNCYWT